ncbi:MAG: hypothetical protein WC365_07845 [Candidatus Babeliales bacterium]|jgi:hypothetical protein
MKKILLEVEEKIGEMYSEADRLSSYFESFKKISISDNEFTTGGMELSLTDSIGNVISIDTATETISMDNEQIIIDTEISIAVDMYCESEIRKNKKIYYELKKMENAHRALP